MKITEIALLLSIFLLYTFLNNTKCKYIDNKNICINKNSDDEKYNILTKISNKLDLLIKYLNRHHKNDKITTTINKNYRKNIIFSELSKNKAIAYTKNKGEEMSFCLPDKNNDFNTLIFIALHELSHISTDEIGHTYTFWENFKFLLKIAIKINIYKPVDYNKYPTNYCNLDITHNPLF